jgi:hypothetical protein
LYTAAISAGHGHSRRMFTFGMTVQVIAGTESFVPLATRKVAREWLPVP